MMDYKQIYGDYYGVMKRNNGEVETVPFLEFQRKSDHLKCRIPVEAYNKLLAKGLTRDKICDNYAQFYHRMVIAAKKREATRKGIYIHSIYEWLAFLETIISDKIYEQITKMIETTWEKKKAYLSLEQLKIILPSALAAIMLARVAADESKNLDPQKGLDKYCKLILDNQQREEP